MRLTSWVFTWRGRGVKLETTENKSNIEPRNSGLEDRDQISTLNHLATVWLLSTACIKQLCAASIRTLYLHATQHTHTFNFVNDFVVTGMIWARYSLVIIPKNWLLFSVNIGLGITGINQLCRIAQYVFLVISSRHGRQPRSYNSTASWFSEFLLELDLEMAL